MTKHILAYIGVLVLGGLLTLGVLRFAPQKFAESTVSNFPVWFSNGINIGSAGPNPNEVDQIVSGNFVYNLGALGPFGSTTSTTSTVLSVASTSMQKLVVGDSCIGGDTAASGTYVLGVFPSITGISSTLPNASLTVAFSNLGTASITVATGTIKYTCFHTKF